jgi:hypothetical protein
MRHVRTAILGLILVGGTLVGTSATALADSPAPLPIGGAGKGVGGLVPPLPINGGVGQLAAGQ